MAVEDYSAAEAAAAEALEVRMRLFGPDHADTAASLALLGVVHRETERFGTAESLLREALRIDRAAIGELQEATFEHVVDLAHVLRDARRYEQAVAVLRESLELARREAPQRGHPAVADRLNRLQHFLAWVPDSLEESESLLREMLDMRRRLSSDHSVDLAVARFKLGAVCLLQGKLPEAERLLRPALAAFRRTSYPSDQYLAGATLLLGLVLREQARLEQAEPLLRESARLYRSTRGEHSWTVGLALWDLACVRRTLGDNREADQLEEEAREIFRESPPWTTLQTALRIERIARHSEAAGAFASAAAAWEWVARMRGEICPGHPSDLAARQALAACNGMLNAVPLERQTP